MTDGESDIYEETLAVFGQSDGVEPLTTPEVAAELDCGRRGTYERLGRLVERGALRTKSVGANARVWWRPADDAAPSSTLDEAVVEAVRDGVAVVDADMRFEAVNEELLKMTGYDRAELLGTHESTLRSDASGPDVPDTFDRARAALDAGSDVETVETELVPKDGDPFPAELRMTTAEVNGDPSGLVGVVRDTSRREARKRRLERSRRHYRTLVENFPNGAVALLDNDLRVLTVDGSLFEAVEWTPERFEGEVVSAEMPFDGAAAVAAACRTASNGETVVERIDVEGLTVEVRATGVREGAETVAVIVTGQDISGQVTREHDMQALNRSLRRHNDRLDRVTDAYTAVDEAIDGLATVSGVDAVERVVCEALAKSPVYDVAAIRSTGVGPDRLSRAAGVDRPSRLARVIEAWLDDCPDGPTVLRPASLPTPVAVDAEALGIVSAIALPLTWGQATFGTLVVGTDRPDAFDVQEQAAVSTLSRTVGLAVSATRNRSLLHSSAVTRLELDGPGRGRFPTVASDRLDCTLTLRGTVPVDGDRFLFYISVDGTSRQAFEDLATGHDVDRLRYLGRDDGESLYELGLPDGSFVRELTDCGAEVKSARVENGRLRMVVDVPSGTDPDVVRSILSPEHVVSKRTVTADGRDRPVGPEKPEASNRLSRRQWAALQTAYAGGYFDWPRRASTGGDLAASLDITPQTFHEHLRKAQRKVVESFLDAQTRPP